MNYFSSKTDKILTLFHYSDTEFLWTFLIVSYSHIDYIEDSGKISIWPRRGMSNEFLC